MTAALIAVSVVLLALLLASRLALGGARRQLAASREETSAARMEAASLAEQLAEARRAGQGADAVGELAALLSGRSSVSRGTLNTGDDGDIGA